MRTYTTIALAAMLLAGAPAAAQETPFEATGEVRFLGWGNTGTGASFDEERIVGPSVNLSRLGDGTWAGDLAGHDLNLQITGTKVSGPNVTISFATRDGRTTVEGLFYGQRVRLELDEKGLRGKVGTCSVDLARKNAQYYRGNMGCLPAGGGVPRTYPATLQLMGEAAAERPPQPQLALALVAALPG